jgi:hypothetical protein
MKKVLLVVGLILIGASILAYILKAEIEQGVSDGYAYAQTHAQGDCVESALKRLTPDIGMSDRMEILVFSRACLQRASHDPEYCRQIPANVFEAHRFIADQCARFGRDHKTCEKVIQYSASACAGSLPGMR